MQSAKLAAVGKLVSGIAHEVNNPVSIIKMHIASVMQNTESHKLSEDLIKTLRVIQRQNNKVSQIMAGLLAFSRQGSFSPEWTDVNQTVHVAVGLIENTLQNQDIVYQAELSDSLPRVFLDPIRIEQVLVNLFNNAIDTMSGGGVLTVSTTLETDETHRDWVVIRVKDTGEGIDEEHIDQLFDPDEFLIVIERALKLRRARVENIALKQLLDTRFRFENIIGNSEAITQVFDLIRKISNTPANVLITGESGTGKELVAQCIHANSKRSHKPLFPRRSICLSRKPKTP